MKLLDIMCGDFNVIDQIICIRQIAKRNGRGLKQFTYNICAFRESVIQSEREYDKIFSLNSVKQRN
jgi:hypothetical protein